MIFNKNSNKKRSGRKMKVGHTTTTLVFIQPGQEEDE